MKKVVARITAEVIGSPKEHVVKTLHRALDKLPSEEGVKIIGSKQHECEQMENSKLFSTFAEVEFEVESFKKLLDICYDYTPSSIEILEPAGLDVDTNDLRDFLNDFLARLHKYGMVLKKLQGENIWMMRELEKVTGRRPKPPSVKIDKD
tara:strand:+ start:988 stop:1437 length:450 start_codon:yes stop_codon:yes gene_type:complete